MWIFIFSKRFTNLVQSLRILQAKLMLALFTPTKLPPSHNTTPSNLNTFAKKNKKHVDDVLMCFPNTLLHQSSVYLMKARMQSYASCGVDSGETASVVHLHRNLLHAHTIMIIEEFGPFIAISFLLSCSDTLMNLNATQYLGCFSVVFVGLYCFLQQHSVSRLSVNNCFLLQTAKA